MMPFTWSRGMLAVPLKFMCSHQWDTPVRPGRSSFEPTLYQHHTDASGAVCSSWMSTFSPLSRFALRRAAGASFIVFIIKSEDTHAGVERDRQPAADRLPDEGEPADERARNARPVGGDGPLREDSGAPQGGEHVRAARRSAVRERQHPHGDGAQQNFE